MLSRSQESSLRAVLRGRAKNGRRLPKPDGSDLRIRQSVGFLAWKGLGTLAYVTPKSTSQVSRIEAHPRKGSELCVRSVLKGKKRSGDAEGGKELRHATHSSAIHTGLRGKEEELSLFSDNSLENPPQMPLSPAT